MGNTVKRSVDISEEANRIIIEMKYKADLANERTSYSKIVRELIDKALGIEGKEEKENPAN